MIVMTVRLTPTLTEGCIVSLSTATLSTKLLMDKERLDATVIFVVGNFLKALPVRLIIMCT